MKKYLKKCFFFNGASLQGIQYSFRWSKTAKKRLYEALSSYFWIFFSNDSHPFIQVYVFRHHRGLSHIFFSILFCIYWMTKAVVMKIGDFWLKISFLADAGFFFYPQTFESHRTCVGRAIDRFWGLRK